MKTQLGHYDIVAELGRGGMGVVYKGYESSLNRYVAIKVLADSLAHDPAVKERFLREARSMASLNDQHIIQIYFIGDDDGQTYFVMEFVDGESLGSILKREIKLKPEQAAKIIFQTAQGLLTAHDKGVIHRDIKPGNLMISSRGSVKIADFGIALTTQDFSKKLTSTGEFVGTPGYLSPEVCLGKPVDQRSDIFSLGIVLFECLAGRMPFTDESPLGLMLEVVKAEIPDVCTLNSEVDPELSRILSRMIAKDPADRYQSCQGLIEDLGKHPLVAKGGPITLQTRVSAAAATMIGQKTPVSGQRPLPNTTPTPVPVAPAAATPARPLPAVAPAPVHESVLQRSAPAGSKSTALPLAIAALLLLALGGGAWAFRDQIPFVKQMLAQTQFAATSSAPATPPAAASNTSTEPSSPPATPAPPAPVTAAVTTASTGAETSNSAAVSAPAETASSSPASSADSTVATTTTAANSAGVSANDAAGTTLAATNPAVQSATAPKQVARTEMPPPVSAPPRPHVSTVAVIAGGDEAISEPAEQEIEKALARRGYRLVDQNMMPRVDRLLNGPRPNYAEILNVIARRGNVDAIVVVHARAIGEQQITYYGQSDSLKTAHLNITAYAVEGQRKLGGGWNEDVHFTALGASDKAREAVEPMLQEIEERLTEFRPPHTRG
jgi:serine/threonine-protein kinase